MDEKHRKFFVRRKPGERMYINLKKAFEYLYNQGKEWISNLDKFQNKKEVLEDFNIVKKMKEAAEECLNDEKIKKRILNEYDLWSFYTCMLKKDIPGEAIPIINEILFMIGAGEYALENPQDYLIKVRKFKSKKV